jgi:hypothetical protein
VSVENAADYDFDEPESLALKAAMRLMAVPNSSVVKKARDADLRVDERVNRGETARNMCLRGLPAGITLILTATGQLNPTAWDAMECASMLSSSQTGKRCLQEEGFIAAALPYAFSNIQERTDKVFNALTPWNISREKLENDVHHLQTWAANKIASLFRAKKAAELSTRFRMMVKAEMGRRNKAAATLQAHHRGRQARKRMQYQQSKFEGLQFDAAATVIQRFERRRQAYKVMMGLLAVRRGRWAILRLQACRRGHAGRHTYHLALQRLKTRQLRVTLMLQRAIRKWLVRTMRRRLVMHEQLEKLKASAALTIQTVIKVRLQRVHHRATRIQCAYRRLKARKVAEELRWANFFVFSDACLDMQRVVRGWWGRQAARCAELDRGRRMAAL